MEELYEVVRRGLQFPPYVSTQAKDIIIRFLALDPSKRTSADEALRHTWLTNTLATPSPHLSQDFALKTPVPEYIDALDLLLLSETITIKPLLSKTQYTPQLTRFLSHGPTSRIIDKITDTITRMPVQFNCFDSGLKVIHLINTRRN